MEKRFPEFGSDYSFSKLEEKILAFWRSEKIFQRSLDNTQGKKEFYFYDGPPFATGLPHYGHLLAGTIKDIVPRYWTQRGYHVARKFGWDCHGLPVEFEMEKTLGLSGSLAIRDYGVAKFNEACRGTVLRYAADWKRVVERLGRWIDMDNDYKTMDAKFMESVWWVFKELHNKGLIYQGKKVVPYSWRLTAPLSNFEASLNYKSIQDPSISVLMPLKDSDLGSDVAIAIWTTTPWTLPSNLAVAIQMDPKKVQYSLYELKESHGNIRKIVIADFAYEVYQNILGNKLQEISATQLLGQFYVPLFDVFNDEERKAQKAFRVIDGSGFVTSGTGTGLVHCAPAFGEDDFFACQANGIEAVDPTDMQATFTDKIKADATLASIQGVFVKDADKTIIGLIKDKKRLLKQDTLQHSYPFCERSDTPLIYKAISSWFVKVESMREAMLANNQKIRWVPDNIKEGRFGTWLANARDWCISRNRFWGTPIPVWICEKCEKWTVVGSQEELEKLSSKKVPDLHMHFVDEIKIDCSHCGEKQTMKRTPEVLDCWFESGSMPYAQEHYPFENKEKLDQSFPADFIAEGLDQTRGWFYTLTVLSTALFGKPAFESCIVNGIVLAEDGRKMSKRLKNYPDPTLIFEKYGADALRLYLVQSPAMHAEDLRFTEKQLVELMRAVMLPLWNAYSFFSSYANIDLWYPEGLEVSGEATDLDRWILGRVKETESQIHEKMEAFHLYEVPPLLTSFIDDLTNWYIRLNRERFWSERNSKTEANKEAAYSTLYCVLMRLTKILSPVLPFMSEVLFASLNRMTLDELKGSKVKSVHESFFDDLSTLSLSESDKTLLRQVSVAKKIILLGRSLRGEAKIGLRQPLLSLRVAGLSQSESDELSALKGLVCQELNIRSISLVDRASDLVEESARPNFKILGKRIGPDMKELQSILQSWTSKDILDFEAKGVWLFKGHELKLGEIEIVRKAKEGRFALAQFSLVAELDTTLNDELLDEGVQRELVNRIQQRRKEMKLKLTDRIEVKWWATPGSRIERVLTTEDFLRQTANETLSNSFEQLKEAPSVEKENLEGHGELSFEVKI
ncbi:MAG: isoleucine--tRNA ligase [Proteobacteria bacterium]|nr:isoleucine--tRNA ligase [Pseudomonadota bacterium]